MEFVDEQPSFNLLGGNDGEQQQGPRARPQSAGASCPPGRTAEVPPPRAVRTFADVLAGGTGGRVQKRTFNALIDQIPTALDATPKAVAAGTDPVARRQATTLNGKTCIYLTKGELETLAKPLDLTLIGKFPAGRPKWVTLQRYFRDLKLHGAYKVSHLDSKHFVLHLTNQDDYVRIFSRTVSSIGSFTVKYLKWSLGFDVSVESPVTPIWINMPMLKMSMFTQEMLYSIAQVYGTPLLIDSPTAAGVKPNIARALVEMDVLKEFPEEVWMGNEEEGYLQKVRIERKPKYCGHCSKFGHVEDECYSKHPHLQELQTEKGKEKPEEGSAGVNAEKEGVDKVDAPAVKPLLVPAEVVEDGPEQPAANLGISVLEGEPEPGEAEAGSYDKQHWEELDRIKSKFWADYKKEMEEDVKKSKMQDMGVGDEEILNANPCNLMDNQPEVTRLIEVPSDKSVEALVVDGDDFSEQEFLEETAASIQNCYFRSRDEEIRSLMASSDGTGETLAGNSLSEGMEEPEVADLGEQGGTQSRKKDSNRKEKHKIDPATITKVNAIDMMCMGFEVDFSQEEEDIQLAEGLTPPHRKNRRNSWGDEFQEEVDHTIKSKKGRKKRKEVHLKQSISPRRTRGKTKEIHDSDC